MGKRHKHGGHQNVMPPAHLPAADVKVSGSLQVFESAEAIQQHCVERAEDTGFKKGTSHYEKWGLRASWAVFIVTTLYLITTAAILWQTTEAARAAKKSADTAAKQLELAERPWVDASVTLDGPFDFNVNGGNLHLKLALKNSGHTPAQFVDISYLPLIGRKSADAVLYRNQACRDVTRMVTSFGDGVSLFPNVEYVQQANIGFGNEEIQNEKALKEFPGSKFPEDALLSPGVVLCIGYRASFNEKAVYHTAQILDLLRLDAANRPNVMFKINETVDSKHLLLRLHPENAIYAD